MVNSPKDRLVYQLFLLLKLFMSYSGVSAQDILVRASLSKEQVVVQEPVVLTYTVYSKYSISQFDGNYPTLSNFTMHELPLTDSDKGKTVVINGQEYKSAVWSKFLIYPLHAGKIEIPSVSFTAKVIVPNTNGDALEAFFNGGKGYEEVTANVFSLSVGIDVKELPPPPADFSKGVGKFSVAAQIDSSEIVIGQPVRIRVCVAGCGNTRLMSPPVVHFPKAFDVYDVKVTDSTLVTKHGYKGRMIYEYSAAPRYAGAFTVPDVVLDYYDLDSAKFCKIMTEPFQISVRRGDRRNADDDLRDIRKGTDCFANGNKFWGNRWYWLSLIAILLSFTLAFYVYRYVSKKKADNEQQRENKAKDEFLKRLKKAEKLMSEQRAGEFYEEVLHALWGYAGDKLHIKKAELSRGNIEKMLRERGVKESAIELFVDAVNVCEYNHYAPSKTMKDLTICFNQTKNAIERIHSALSE